MEDNVTSKNDNIDDDDKISSQVCMKSSNAKRDKRHFQNVCLNTTKGFAFHHSTTHQNHLFFFLLHIMIFSLFFVAKRDKRHTGFTAKSDISMTDLDKEKTKLKRNFLKNSKI